MKYSEILRENRKLADKMAGPPYKIAVLGNVITHQLNEILEYFLRYEGINAHVVSGEYDGIVQDSSSLKGQDAYIIFWELSNLVDGFHYKANLLTADAEKILLQKVKMEIDFVLQNLATQPKVIFNQFSATAFRGSAIEPDRYETIAHELNTYIKNTSPPNTILFDIEKVFSKISLEKSIDLRYYYSSKALYSVQFYQEYAQMISPVICSINGKSKKAIIFDCDNTLWKGILGEDGMDGIDMSSHNAEGSCFSAIQNMAIELSTKGILVGLCSKNNPEDVENVLCNHPDMQLRNEHITIKTVNWHDKVMNLRAIAEQLNIATEALVFVDDSDFEVDLVRNQMPEVTVVQVPKKLSDYPSLLRDTMNLFHTESLVDEDLRREAMYSEESQRDGHKSSYTSVDDYIASLGLEITVAKNSAETVERAAQLTQKTNQFNLTTIRYTKTSISEILTTNHADLFVFSVRDKFGDYGKTGLCILNYEEDSDAAVIDTFLMSCRTLGRKIEFSFFDFLIVQLAQKGIRLIHAEYRKTLKNEQVNDLYEKLGFTLLHSDEEKKIYTLEIEKYKSFEYSYIRIDHGK